MLESRNLKYRPITLEDTDMVLKWRNSDFVRNRFIYRSVISREEHVSWFNNRVVPGEVIQFIIIEKSSDMPIGSVYLRDVDREAKQAEYGIFIGEESARGKGYGSETASCIVGYCFETLGFNKLMLRVLEGNEAAIRSYEHAGFTRDPGSEEEIDIEGKKERVIFLSICRT